MNPNDIYEDDYYDNMSEEELRAMEEEHKAMMEDLKNAENPLTSQYNINIKEKSTLKYGFNTVTARISKKNRLMVQFDYNKNKVKVTYYENKSRISTGFTKKSLCDIVYIIKQLKNQNKYNTVSFIDEDAIASKLSYIDNKREDIKSKHLEMAKEEALIKQEEDETPDFLKERLHPDYDEDIALKINDDIINNGLYNYLGDIYDKMTIGSKKPFFRTFLAAIIIPLGIHSTFIGNKAQAESGKSYQTVVAVKKTIPEIYLYNVNASTSAAFLRKSQEHTRIFDRMILIFGDLGGDQQFISMLTVFDILKVLITENEFSKDLLDDKNKLMHLNLVADYIGAIYETVNIAIMQDEQILSRSIEVSPDFLKNKRDVINFSLYSDDADSVIGRIYAQAEEELLEFQEYIKYCINMDDVNIKTNVYNSFFEELSLNSQGEPSERRVRSEIKMFEGQCRLELERCFKTKEGYYIPTRSQLNEFVKNVTEFTGLTPAELHLVKDIAKRVTAITESDVYKMMDEIKGNSDYAEYFHNQYGLSQAKYKEDNYFFTVTLIHSHMATYPSVKNIAHLDETLLSIYNKGYASKLYSKYNEHNIYFLNPKAMEFLKDEIKVEDKHVQDAVNKLKSEYDIDVSFDDLNT